LTRSAPFLALAFAVGAAGWLLGALVQGSRSGPGEVEAPRLPNRVGTVEEAFAEMEAEMAALDRLIAGRNHVASTNDSGSLDPRLSRIRELGRRLDLHERALEALGIAPAIWQAVDFEAMTTKELRTYLLRLQRPGGHVDAAHVEGVAGALTELLRRNPQGKRAEKDLRRLRRLYIYAKRRDDAARVIEEWGPAIGWPTWTLDNFRADTASARGDYAEFRTILGRIVAATEAPAWARAEAMFNVGRAYHREARFSDAITEYQRVVETFGRSQDPTVLGCVQSAKLFRSKAERERRRKLSK
jgi:tetratricopeptide (TPR) repeat protein